MTPGGSSGLGASGAPDAEAAIERPPFWIVSAITVTAIMAATIVNPALPDIVRDLGRSPSAVGILVAAVTAPGIVLAPVIGLLADRYGRKEIIVPCLVLFGVSGGISSFAPNFEALVALRLLQGVGSAGLINLAIVIIGDHWDGAERARMIGRNAAVLTASVVVLPPIGGLLAAAFGWRATFVPFWIGLITAGAVTTRIPRSVRGVPVSFATQVRATRPYLTTRTVIGAMVGGFTVFVIIFGLFLTVMPVYLDRAFHLGPGARGLVAGLPSITSTVGALSNARLRARFGNRRVVFAALACFAAAFGLIAGVSALWAVLVGALIYGLGEGTVIPIFQDTVAGAAPASSRGSVVALFVGVLRTGQTVGPMASSQGLRVAAWGSVGARSRVCFGVGAALATALALATPALVASREEGPVLAGSASPS